MDTQRYEENTFKTPILNGSNPTENDGTNKPISMSPQRMKYEAQVQVIRERIGGLEVVRARLGLSQRKICQLLMVDPSAWNRWLKDESAPPHIWRMLEWYLGLQDKLPGLSPNFFLGEFNQAKQNKQLKDLQMQIEMIQAKFEQTQKEQFLENEKLRFELKRWRKNFNIALFLFIFLIVSFAFKQSFAQNSSNPQTKNKFANENQTYYKDKNPQSENSDQQESRLSQNQATKSVTMPIGYYTPETSLAFGVLHLHNYNQATIGKTSNSLSHLSYTLKKQTLFNSTTKFYLQEGRYEWGTQVIYRYFPDEFYGSEINSSPESTQQGEKFTEKVSILGLTGGYQFFSNYYLRSMVQQDHREILLDKNETTPLLNTEVDRFSDTLNTTVLQLSLDFDDRDFIQSAKNGDWLKIGYISYFPKNKKNENISPISKTELEYRKYFSINSQQILAGQLLISQVKSQKSEPIPFYYLNSIGGGARLRGYYSGRYRDQALVMTQFDYRYEWNDRWVSTIFYSAARIGSDLQKINQAGQAKWLSSSGLGLNYFIDPTNRTKLRLDMGIVAEKRSIYFLIGDAI